MRKIVRLMKNWQFIGPEGNTTTVDLPHTWNAIDGQDGGNDYWRGTCVYRTRFAAPAFEEVSQQDCESEKLKQSCAIFNF